MFLRAAFGEFYLRYVYTLLKRKSPSWNNLQCHRFHKKENITNCMVVLYGWYLPRSKCFPLVQCGTVLQPNIALRARGWGGVGGADWLTWKHFNSEKSRLGLLWLLYTFTHLCSTSSTQWEAGTLVCIFWQQRVTVSQSGWEWRNGCQRRFPSNWYLYPGICVFTTECFLAKISCNIKQMKLVWMPWKTREKPPDHMGKPWENSWRQDLKQLSTHTPTGWRVYLLLFLFFIIINCLSQ